MPKPILSAAVSPKLMERIEEYAEEKGISKSEATARLVEKSLDIEQSEGVHLVSTDGGKTQEQLDAISSQLDEIQTDDGLSEVESFVAELRSMMLPLTLSILWIGIEIAFGFPFEPFVTAATGIPLILWLAYPQLREMYE